jgi:WD40 repeat protein
MALISTRWVIGLCIGLSCVGCSMQCDVCALNLSSDGRCVAIATTNGAVAAWDTTARTAVSTMTLRGQAGSRCEAVAFADDDRLIVSADWLVQDHFGAPGGMARVTFWDVPSGTPRKVFTDTGGQALAVSPNGRQVAASSGGPISVFDTRSGQISRRKLDSKQERITCLSFSADGEMLVAAGSDRWSTWNPHTGELRKSIQFETPSMILDATFNSDGSQVLLVGNEENVIRYFDAQTGEEQKRVAWEHGYRQLSVSRDHKRMASCGHSAPGIFVWDVDTGRKLTRFGPRSHYSHVAISADGRVIAGARAGSTGIDGIDTWHYDPDQKLSE